ncbi:MAG: PspC domain-containing protein [Candidatus Micrarchaeia archaeon]
MAKENEPAKKLYRSNSEKLLGGVCGGMAEYFGVDPIIIRLIFVALGLMGPGILLYIIAWIFVPKKAN